jgi:hypothetical protein
MPADAYPWFAGVTGGGLDQGDVLADCPVLAPVVPGDLEAVRRGEGELDAEVFTGRLVVMTQACDLAHGKVDSVVLCPAWSIDEMEAADVRLGALNSKDRKKHWERARKGEMAAYHLLAEWPELALPVLVVDFHRIYTAPKDYLSAFAERAGQRPRLLPPYREHLSQAFARYFMRVGLPVDIPPFK